MTTPDRAAALREAYRRNILPPDQRAAYEEGVRRGRIRDPYAAGRIRSRTPLGEASAATATVNEAIPLMDEAAAGMGVVADFVTGRNRNVGSSWRENRDFQQGLTDDFRQRRPNASALSTGTGYAIQTAPFLMTGGASAAPTVAASPGGGMVQGAQRIGARVVRNGVTGGTVGGVNGLTGRGTVQERIIAGREGATGGAIVGGVAPEAVNAASVPIRMVANAGANVVRTGARVLNRTTGGQILNPRTEAERRLVEAMRRDRIEPEQINTAITEWRRVGGPSPTFMDIVNTDGRGQNTMALIRAAASRGGPARTLAVQHADQTAGNIQDVAINRTRQLTAGETRTPDQYQAALRTGQRAADDVNYPLFENEPVPMGDDITGALYGDAGRSLLNDARGVADLTRNLSALREIDDLLAGNSQTNVSAGTIDLIRRVARDRAGVASRAGEQTLASGWQGRRNELETALDDIPGAAQARAEHRGYSQASEAVDLGAGARLADPDAYAAALRAAEEAIPPGGPNARQAAGVGMRQDLVTTIGAPAEGSTGALNRIATSTNMNRNLAETYGPEAAADYQAAIGNTVDQLGNARFISPNTGSQTAPRLLDAQLVEMPSMTPAGLARAALSKLVRGASMTEDEAAALVRIATSRDTDQAVAETDILKRLLMMTNPSPGMLSYLGQPVGHLMAIQQGQ